MSSGAAARSYAASAPCPRHGPVRGHHQQRAHPLAAAQHAVVHGRFQGSGEARAGPRHGPGQGPLHLRPLVPEPAVQVEPLGDGAHPSPPPIGPASACPSSPSSSSTLSSVRARMRSASRTWPTPSSKSVRARSSSRSSASREAHDLLQAPEAGLQPRPPIRPAPSRRAQAPKGSSSAGGSAPAAPSHRTRPSTTRRRSKSVRAGGPPPAGAGLPLRVLGHRVPPPQRGQGREGLQLSGRRGPERLPAPVRLAGHAPLEAPASPRSTASPWGRGGGGAPAPGAFQAGSSAPRGAAPRPPCLEGPGEPLREAAQRAQQGRPVLDGRLGGGRGRGRPQVGHQVGDGDVHLVAHAGDDRHGAAADGPGHRLLVEGPQVFDGAAAPPHDDAPRQRPLAASTSTARAISPAAPSPCTRASPDHHPGPGRPPAETERMSRRAAPLGEVTTPTRPGSGESGRLRAGSRSPSASSLARSFSNASRHSPSAPSASTRADRHLVVAPSLVERERPVRLHLHALFGVDGQALGVTAPQDAVELGAVVLQGEVAVPLTRPRPVAHLARHPEGVDRVLQEGPHRAVHLGHGPDAGLRRRRGLGARLGLAAGVREQVESGVFRHGTPQAALRRLSRRRPRGRRTRPCWTAAW